MHSFSRQYISRAQTALPSGGSDRLHSGKKIWNTAITPKMIGGEKCTFGTRIAIDIHMLNEIIYREVKHFRNYKIYRPNFGSIPVTGKFYAAHAMFEDSEEQAKKIEHYVNKVSEARAAGPHSKYPGPVTGNQTYGWYTQPIYPIDRDDRRFYKPKTESNHTKVEVLILMANPRSKKSDKTAASKA